MAQAAISARRLLHSQASKSPLDMRWLPKTFEPSLLRHSNHRMHARLHCRLYGSRKRDAKRQENEMQTRWPAFLGSQEPKHHLIEDGLWTKCHETIQDHTACKSMRHACCRFSPARSASRLTDGSECTSKCLRLPGFASPPWTPAARKAEARRSLRP